LKPVVEEGPGAKLQMKEPGEVPPLERLLGDERGGKLIVELGEEQS
jgi:hypothetical protein